MLSLLKKCFSRKVMVNIVSCVMLFVFMGNAEAIDVLHPVINSLNIVVNNQGAAISNVNNFRLTASLTDADVENVKNYFTDMVHWCIYNQVGSDTIIDGIPSSPVYAVPNLFYGIGAISNGSVQYTSADKPKVCLPKFNVSDIANHRNFDVLVSFSSKGVLAPGVYSVSTAGGPLIALSGNGGADYGARWDIHGNVTVIASTCQLQTSRDLSVNWPSLSSDDIQNNTADNKPAVITLGCEDNSSHPVTVTVTSNNDASGNVYDGVVNTNVRNLGLQLTWGSNGQKIPINTPLSFDARDTKDFSINAQPVNQDRGAGFIPAGDFSADVTVSFEYH